MACVNLTSKPFLFCTLHYLASTVRGGRNTPVITEGLVRHPVFEVSAHHHGISLTLVGRATPVAHASNRVPDQDDARLACSSNPLEAAPRHFLALPPNPPPTPPAPAPLSCFDSFHATWSSQVP